MPAWITNFMAMAKAIGFWQAVKTMAAGHPVYAVLVGVILFLLLVIFGMWVF